MTKNITRTITTYEVTLIGNEGQENQVIHVDNVNVRKIAKDYPGFVIAGIKNIDKVYSMPVEQFMELATVVETEDK